MNTWLERIHHIDTQAFIWVNLKQGCHYRKLVRQISRTGDGPLYVAIGLVLFLFETLEITGVDRLIGRLSAG